jgi:hypothetical protein
MPKTVADGLTRLANARGLKRGPYLRMLLLRSYEHELRLEEQDRAS